MRVMDKDALARSTCFDGADRMGYVVFEDIDLFTIGILYHFDDVL